MEPNSNEPSVKDALSRTSQAELARRPPGARRQAALSAAARPRQRAADSHADGLFNIVSLLHALRLRWPWMLLLGAPLAALLAYLAWTNVPTPYTAYAELFCQPRRFFWQTSEDDPAFHVYKQTTMRLIKDPMVLTAALRDPKVAQLPYVIKAQDILLKLSEELRVLSPAEEFIRIELQDASPADVPIIVNAVTDAFVAEVVVKESQARRTALDELRALLRREEEKLIAKQTQMRKMDKELEVPNSTQSDSKRQSQLDMQLELRKQMALLQPQIIELQLLLSAEETPPAKAETDVESPAVVNEELEQLLFNDREYVELWRRVRNSERILAEWKRRVNEDNPAIKRHVAELRSAEEALAARRAILEPLALEQLRRKAAAPGATSVVSSTTSREQLSNRLKMLEALRDRYAAEIESLQVAERKLAVDWVDREALAEDIQTLKETVSTYAAEVLKREVELDNAPPPIRIHQRARTPTLPDTRKQIMLTVAGAIGGFVLVVVTVLFFEVRAQRISDLSFIRRNVAAPVMGVVPLIPYSARRALQARRNTATAYWRDVICEAFDEIRTVLLHNPHCMGARVIMVASSSAAEGKSTTASQLALSLARSGHRVLLMDGDLRRPTMEREFGLPRQQGLCEVLNGSATLADVIRSTDLPELDLLPAGVLTNQVRGLVARDAHSPVLMQLFEQYHFVIIDTAPVLLTTDTLLLARHVDGVLVVVRKDVTQQYKLEATLRRFEMIGVPILGVVGVGLSDSSPSYGYGYGYGYGYSQRHGYAAPVEHQPQHEPEPAAAPSA